MTTRAGLAFVCSVLCASTGQSRQALTTDPTTEPIWHNPQPTIGTPAVSGNDVFALTADHQVLKLSLHDGSEQWRVPTGEHGVTYGHTLATTPSMVLVGEYDIIAFDRVTGRRRWTFTPRQGYAPGPYLGDVQDDLAFAGSASGHLHAVDLRTGDQHWTTAVDPDGQSTVYWPQLAGDAIVAGVTAHDSPARGALVSLAADDGHERWRFEFPKGSAARPMAGGPIVTGDLVIAASGDGRIWAVDRDTGTFRWTLPALTGDLDSIVRPGEQDHRALALSGSTLVAGSTTGYVVGYDLAEGQEMWRYAGGRLGSTAFRLAARDGTVFVPYVSGFLVALDAASGRLLWRTDDWRQGFIWPPAIAGTVGVVSSRQGLWGLNIRP